MPMGQRQRHNGDVALGEAGLGDHLDAADQNGAEHHQRAAAQHRLGQACKKVADWRQQSRQNHAGRAGHDGEAVDHAGHVDQSHVLAEGGHRRAAKQAGDGAGVAVAGQWNR